MPDTTWIRSYGSKDVYIDRMLRVDDGVQVDGLTIIRWDWYVVWDMIEQDSIDSTEIQDESLTTSDIKDWAITIDKLFIDSVISSKIRDKSIEEIDLADWIISTRTIENYAVTREKIAPWAIDSTLIDNTTVQVRINSSCPVWQDIKAIHSDWTIDCQGWVNTTNYIPKSNGITFDNSLFYEINSKLGLWTTSPLAKFHVKWDIRADEGYKVDWIEVISGKSWVIWDRIEQNSVDSSEIENNTLTANDLAANSVWASELANNSVGSSNVIDNSLTSADLAANSVWNSELIDSPDFIHPTASTPTSSSHVATKGYVDNKSFKPWTNCSWNEVWKDTWRSSYICPNNGIVTGIKVEDTVNEVVRVWIRCCY